MKQLLTPIKLDNAYRNVKIYFRKMYLENLYGELITT